MRIHVQTLCVNPNNQFDALRTLQQATYRHKQRQSLNRHQTKLFTKQTQRYLLAKAISWWEGGETVHKLLTSLIPSDTTS